MTERIQTLEGKPKGGKSTEALRRAVAAAREGKRTYYASDDTTKNLERRLGRVLAEEEGKPVVGLFFSTGTCWIRDSIEDDGVRFVVLDGLPLPDYLPELAEEHGVEVLLVQNTRKAQAHP